MGIVIASFVLLFCLYQLLFGGDSSTVSSNDDEIVFKSSFTRGGSLVVPQKLIFTHTSVKLVTNTGSDSLWTTTSTQTIPYNKIVGVNVTRFLVGCNIVIIGKGVQNILAIGFTGGDTNKIEQMVNSILDDN